MSHEAIVFGIGGGHKPGVVPLGREMRTDGNVWLFSIVLLLVVVLENAPYGNVEDDDE